MTRRPVPLRMYAAASEAAPLEWDWVDEQLAAAGTYWIAARSPAHPHPRPVWGVWLDDALLLSVGSPVVLRQLQDDARTTVHLDSGTDVVIVEGTCTGAAPAPRIPAFLDGLQREIHLGVHGRRVRTADRGRADDDHGVAVGRLGRTGRLPADGEVDHRAGC